MKSTSLLPSFCPPPAPDVQTWQTQTHLVPQSLSSAIRTSQVCTHSSKTNNAYKHMSFRKHSHHRIYLFLSYQFAILTHGVFVIFLFCLQILKIKLKNFTKFYFLNILFLCVKNKTKQKAEMSIPISNTDRFPTQRQQE